MGPPRWVASRLQGLIVEIDAMTLVQLLIKDKGPDTHGLSTILN